MPIDYEWNPYPWPPKEAILKVLNLPPDCSPDEYYEAWNSRILPLRDKSFSKILLEAANSIMSGEGRTFEESWSLAKVRNPSLARAVEREGRTRT